MPEKAGSQPEASQSHPPRLHANVAVPAADRARLEQLCRYLLGPAVAQDRFRLLDDGRIALTLKAAIRRRRRFATGRGRI